MYTISCRIFQTVLKGAMYLLPWRTPEILTAAADSSEVMESIRSRGVSRVLIVTGPHMMKRGLPVPMLESLERTGISYEIFDRLTADPSDEHAEEAAELYRRSGAQGIILFGGGSPMDCGKAAAALIANPGKSVSDLQGVLKVRHASEVPPMWAVPTTAGTGSETTMAAVITDSKTHRKKSISDISIIPHVCVLDAYLTAGIPSHITAYTGMDALCHAVESYINRTYCTELEDRMARKAVRLIYDNLERAYCSGSDMEARSSMQMAAFYAGRAFTRGCVGYVHAIGHGIGGLYGIPHGKAMAVLMPHVFREYGAKAEKRLAELCDVCGLAESACSISEKAGMFISWIEETNRKLDIPDRFDSMREADIDLVAGWAVSEANPLYPVPVVFRKKKMADIIRKTVKKIF